jgi:nicotinamidase-related amidase
MRALLVVDMINDFVNPSGSLYIPKSDDIIPNINRLIEHFKDDAVLYINDSHLKDDIEFSKWPIHAVKGTWGSLEDFRVRPSSYTINKTKYSGFSNTELHKLLRFLDVRSVFISGVATEYCIKETAVSSMRNFYNTFVIVDAVRPVDKVEGDKALITMGYSGIMGIGTKELIGG